jgi:hypothetical protein
MVYSSSSPVERKRRVFFKYVEKVKRIIKT